LFFFSSWIAPFSSLTFWSHHLDIGSPPPHPDEIPKRLADDGYFSHGSGHGQKSLSYASHDPHNAEWGEGGRKTATYSINLPRFLQLPSL